MKSRNDLIKQHFKENYDDLVRRFTQSTPDKTEASAEDLVMEAYRRAIEYFSVLDRDTDSIKDFDAWFFRICINCLSDMFKEGRVKEEHEEYNDNEFEVELPEEIYDLDKRFRILEERIDLEPEVYRDILRYYYINRLKLREINEIVPYSTSHIGKIVKDFHNKVREWLSEETVYI